MSYAESMRELDEIDLAIVRALHIDARLSVRALAERVHISRSSAHARLQSLQDAGVIIGYQAQVDLAKVGRPVRAILVIDTGASPAGSELATDLARVPYVVRTLTIAGDIDYVVEVAAPSHADLSATVLEGVLKLPGVVSVRTHLIIGETRMAPNSDNTTPRD